MNWPEERGGAFRFMGGCERGLAWVLGLNVLIFLLAKSNDSLQFFIHDQLALHSYRFSLWQVFT
ncbi:MAG: hypothetical protein HQL31_09130, partial [Planctomycetes bacterium]|nr:hypothetical protein [Planctomycetota bacterium]